MVGGAGRTVEDRVLAFGDGWAPMITGIEDDVSTGSRGCRTAPTNHSSSQPAVPILTAGRSRVCGTAARIGRSCGSPRTPVARSATATPARFLDDVVANTTH
jgi:hypothetical protein